jgi:hypothetical protein
VIAVSFTAAGCATSTPALPSSDTPAAAHGFLTGENGRADLEKISSYAWGITDPTRRPSPPRLGVWRPTARATEPVWTSHAPRYLI